LRGTGNSRQTAHDAECFLDITQFKVDQQYLWYMKPATALLRDLLRAASAAFCCDEAIVAGSGPDQFCILAPMECGQTGYGWPSDLKTAD